MEGKFELLNIHDKKIKMMDVREFARILTETTGDEQQDKERFFECMPTQRQEAIQLDPERLE